MTDALTSRVEHLERACAVMESRHDTVNERLGDLSEIQEQMSQTLTRLVVLHENNARFFDVVDTMIGEIATLKSEMATQKEWRSWGIAGIGVVLTAVVLAGMGLILVKG